MVKKLRDGSLGYTKYSSSPKTNETFKANIGLFFQFQSFCQIGFKIFVQLYQRFYIIQSFRKDSSRIGNLKYLNFCFYDSFFYLSILLENLFIFHHDLKLVMATIT